MVRTEVPARWRWYQIVSAAVTAFLGLTLLAVGVAAGSVALWVIGAVWVALAAFGLATLKNVAWSLGVDGLRLSVDGPRLHAVVPVTEVTSARYSGVTPARTVLTLEISSLGRVRFGPLPPDAREVLAALQYANPALGHLV